MEIGISEVLSPFVIHNIESSSQYEDWLWLHNILFVIKQYIYLIFKIFASCMLLHISLPAG